MCTYVYIISFLYKREHIPCAIPYYTFFHLTVYFEYDSILADMELHSSLQPHSDKSYAYVTQNNFINTF